MPVPFEEDSASRSSSSELIPNSEVKSCEEKREEALAANQGSYQCVEAITSPEIQRSLEQDRAQAAPDATPFIFPSNGEETFNSACPSNSSTAKWYWSNRFTACQLYGFRWFTTRTDGVVESEVNFTLHQQMSLVVNGGTAYRYQGWIEPVTGFGPLLAGSGTTTQYSCSAGCSATEATPGEQPIVLKRKLYIAYDVSQPTSSGQITTTAQRMDVILSAPSSGVSRYSTAQVSDVQCDSGFAERNRTTGCVFKFAYGVYSLSVSDPAVNETAAHIADAQERLAGHPGRFGDGSPLNYISDATVQAANRRAVCRNFTPSLGGSCDEYPFASTTQGGNPATVSVEDVALDDNTTAGGRLGNVVQRDRLFNNDNIYVVITP